MRLRLENAIYFFPLPVVKLLSTHPLSLVSLFTVLLQGSLSRPLFCRPSGVLGGGLGMQSWYDIRSTWLIQFHLLLWTCLVMGSAPVHQSSSSLEMMSGQKKSKILRSVHWLLLIVIIASFFLGSEDFVHVHTSQRVRGPSTFVCDSCSCGARP